MEPITAKMPRQPRNHQSKTRKLPGNTRSKMPAKKTPKHRGLLLSFAEDILIAILTDGFNSLPFYRYVDFQRDCDTVRRRVRAEGLMFVVKTLPGLSSGVFETLEGRPASYPGFRLTASGTPAFLGRCIDKAIEGRPEYIRFIYQMSVAFKKIECEYSKGCVVDMWREYCQLDEELKNIDWFEDKTFKLIERARIYCAKFAEGLDPFADDVRPRPGPGATNIPIPPYSRYSPSKVHDQVDRVYPYVEWFYPTPWDVNEQARDYLALPRVTEPQSRYKAVPKTALKMRGICIEENEVQYLQQGLRRCLTKHIERHPLYCRRITLSDQSTNQWMAKESSKTRSFATMDLSNASDLVSRELVSWIFQDNEDLHDALMALSARSVQPPPEVGGPVYRTAKFAPMGSAICFPIMSLTIMFIIRAAISLSDLPYPHLLSTNIFIYGDDIVVPSVAYELACEALTRVGLRVNLDKSYCHSHFRESCGVHAYRGVDVTPVFVRKHPAAHAVGKMVSLIETEYQFHTSGYYLTAQTLRNYGSATWPVLRDAYYVRPESSAIGWKRTSVSPHVFLKTCRVKWDPDSQKYIAKVPCITTAAAKCSMVRDVDALLRYHSTSPEPFETRTVDAHTYDDPLRIKRSWVPSWDIYR